MKMQIVDFGISTEDSKKPVYVAIKFPAGVVKQPISLIDLCNLLNQKIEESPTVFTVKVTLV